MQPLRSIKEEATTTDAGTHTRLSLCQSDAEGKGSRNVCNKWRSIQQPDVAQFSSSATSSSSSLWSVRSDLERQQQVGPPQAYVKLPLACLPSWHHRRHLFMGTTMERRGWLHSSQSTISMPTTSSVKLSAAHKLLSRQTAPGGVMVAGRHSCLPDKHIMTGDGESKEGWQAADMERNNVEVRQRRASLVCVVAAPAMDMDGAGDSSRIQLKEASLMKQQRSRGGCRRTVLNLNLAQQVCAEAPPSSPPSLLMCSTSRRSNHRLDTRRAERLLMVCSSIPATTKRSLSYRKPLTSSSQLEDLESLCPSSLQVVTGGCAWRKQHPTRRSRRGPPQHQHQTNWQNTCRVGTEQAAFQQRTKFHHHYYHHHHHYYHHHHHRRLAGHRVLGSTGSTHSRLHPVRLRQPAGRQFACSARVSHRRVAGDWRSLTASASVNTTTTTTTTNATTKTTAIKPMEAEAAASVDERQLKQQQVACQAAPASLESRHSGGPNGDGGSSWGGAAAATDDDDDDSQPAPPGNVHPLEVLTQDSLLAISIYDPLPPIRRRPSLASSTGSCSERQPQQPALGAQGREAGDSEAKPDEDQEQLLLRDLFPLELRKPLSWPSSGSCCQHPPPAANAAEASSRSSSSVAGSRVFELSIEREGVECEPLKLDRGWSRDQLIDRIHQRLLWIQRRLGSGNREHQPAGTGDVAELRCEAARMLHLCLEASSSRPQSRTTPDPTAMSRADRARWADRAQSGSPASRKHTTTFASVTAKFLAGSEPVEAASHESGPQQDEAGQRSTAAALKEEQEDTASSGNHEKRRPAVVRRPLHERAFRGPPEVGRGLKRQAPQDASSAGCSTLRSIHCGSEAGCRGQQEQLLQPQWPDQLQLQHQLAAQRQRRKRRQQQLQPQVADEPPADSSSGNSRLAMRGGSPAPESRLCQAPSTSSCSAGKLAGAANRNNTNASASRSGAAGSPLEAVEAVEAVGLGRVGSEASVCRVAAAAAAVGGKLAASAIEGSLESHAVEPLLEAGATEPKLAEASSCLDLQSQQQASQYEDKDDRVYCCSRLASGSKPETATTTCLGCGCAKRPASIGLLQREQPTSSGAVGPTQNTIGCPDNISLFSQNGLRFCTCHRSTGSHLSQFERPKHLKQDSTSISGATRVEKLAQEKQQVAHVTRPLEPSTSASATISPVAQPTTTTNKQNQNNAKTPSEPHKVPQFDPNSVSNKHSQMTGEQAASGGPSTEPQVGAGDKEAQQQQTKQQQAQTGPDMQQPESSPTTRTPEQPVPQQEHQPQPRANNRSILILREIGPQTEESAVKDIFNSENCQSKPVHCEYALHNSWYVHFKDDEDAKLALAYIRKYIVAWQGQPIMARYKPKPAGPSNASNQPPPTHSHHVPPLVIHQHQQQEPPVAMPPAILAAPETINGLPANPVLPLAAAQATPVLGANSTLLSSPPPPPSQAYQQPVNASPMIHHHQQQHHLVPHQHQPPHHHGYGYSAVAYYGQQGPVLTPWHYSNTQYDFSEVFIYNGLTPYPAPPVIPNPGTQSANNNNNKPNHSHNKVLSQNTAPTMAAVSGAALLGGTDSASLAYHQQHHQPHLSHHHHHHQQQQHHHHNAQHHSHHHNNSHSHSHHNHNSHHHHHHNNNHHHHNHPHPHHHHNNNHHLSHNTGPVNSNQPNRGNSGASGASPHQPATGVTLSPSNDNNNTNNSPSQPLTLPNDTTKPPAHQKGHQKCPSDNNNNTNPRYTNGFSSVNNNSNSNSNQQLGNMSPTVTTPCQPTSVIPSTISSQANSVTTKRPKNPVTSNNSSNRNASANKV